jgi:DNA replication and repair protein RecF
LAPGIVLVTGENGAGKTNLLEAVHVATQGFSPRTRTDGRLISFGESAASVAVRIERGAVGHEVRVKLAAGGGKTAELDGSKLASAEALRREFPTLVFTPDRLAVVKGGPAVRRAYLDRVLGRLLPVQAGLPQDYAAILAQRNAALRRVQLGLSPREVVSPWTARLAQAGERLVAARVETARAIEPGFRERLAELGLETGGLVYEGEAPTAEGLEARFDSDLNRGATGLGPHLHDLAISAAGRELRSFGSQGEQRLALLALLLAEAQLLPGSPLLLLDDVLSELDGRRREVLARAVAGLGQTMITTTHSSLLPVEPDQVVEVTPGTAV